MIISISGLISSGKDTFADYLTSKYNFKRFSFAGPLKDQVAITFGWDRTMLEGLTPEARAEREKIDPWWAERLEIPHLSPRWVLQYWGTEVCRKNFHNDIWVAAMEKRLLSTKDDIVISDARFDNEVETLKKIGACAVRVKRGPDPQWTRYALALNQTTDIQKQDALAELTKLGIHASEYSSVGLNYDYYIDNNGTIQEFYLKIDSLIDKISKIDL